MVKTALGSSVPTARRPCNSKQETGVTFADRVLLYNIQVSTNAGPAGVAAL
jgi:hypothetical protein